MALSDIVASANAAIQSADWTVAINHLRQALVLVPGHAGLVKTYVGVLANAAAACSRVQNHEQAETFALEALSFNPNHAIALANLAAALMAQKRFSEAQVHYQSLIDSDPNDQSARRFHTECVLAAAELELADNQWVSAHRRLRTLSDDHLQASLRRLALPMVYENDVQVQACRQEFEQRLKALCESNLRAKRLEDLVHVNFRLAYQGQDDTALQSAYGTWLCNQSSAFQPKLAPNVPRRIGLLSSFFRECTVGSYFASWIDVLRSRGFEVEVYQLGSTQDAWTERCFASANHGQVLNGTLSDIAQSIAARGLDLLIYPELGMDGRTFVLASLKLARRQACAWGHPITSGLPSMDAYLSAGAMEPHNAATHYCEGLHLLPGIGTHYQNPSPPVPCSRTALNLPGGQVPLVLLSQSPFKLLPANDTRMIALAHAAPSAQFVLFEGLSSGVSHAIQARVRAAFLAHDLNPSRLHFLAMGSRKRFLQVNQQCQLMLDSVGFSGGNTSIDALLCDLPIWLAPGEFMRARQSLAMSQLLGLSGSELDCQQRFELAVRQLESCSRAGVHPEQIQTLLHDPRLPDALASAVETILAK